ncbi:MAG: PQQ-dependent sugar dehydrogenase [Geminicoccaceae bacterium]
MRSNVACCLTMSVVLAAQVAPSQGRAQLPVDRLRAPPGFAIEVFAQVPGARSLAVAEDGARIYVGTRNDRLFAALDPERDGIANEVVEVASGLEVPNGLALGPNGALFVVEQHQISRFDPSGEREIVVPPGVLPDFRHHGWRYAAFGPDGRLYVTIGAPCNVCAVRGFEGTIVRMRPDGHELEIFARGVRNAVGLDWHPKTKELFFTDHGGDQLGDLIPPDELNRAPERDLHFGYPYVYAPDAPYPQFEGRAPPGAITHPVLNFEAHVAALGMHFYRGRMFPDDYRHDAFVAQHGSWNRTDPIGYRLVRVRFDANGHPTGTEVFIDGWLGAGGRVFGRPVDVAELPDGSLLVSDDHAGAIYRITYRRP